MYKNNGKIIICGDTKQPINILDRLFDTESPVIYTIHDRFIPDQKNFILISKDIDLIKTSNTRYPEVKTIYDDASDDEVLINHGIHTAHAIVISYKDDKENLLITLSTRQLNPAIKIISTCSMVDTIKPKLLRAGADTVISPSTINGNLMASKLIRPNTAEFMESFLHRDDNHFSAQEIFITDSDQNNGMTIHRSEYAEADLLILAISRDDTDKIIYNPPSTYVINEGDVLLVLGTIDNFQRLSPYTQYHLKDLEIDTPTSEA